MAVPFPRIKWWSWGKRKEEVAASDDNSSSDCDFGLREPETVKLGAAAAAPRRMKKKWQSRADMRVDREHDIVLVPSDGGCLSGSETDDSDWSIGWSESHASEFLSGDGMDDSFAVLVPCYRNPSKGLIVEPPNIDAKQFLEKWLTSLHN